MSASDRSSAQVHLVLTPSRARDVHWSNEAGATEIWIDDASALGLAAPFLRLPQDPSLPESSNETRQADFTVRASTPGQRITGTVFSSVCEGRSGECRYLAQDFELTLPAGE